MFVVQKERVEIDNDGEKLSPVYSLSITQNVWEHIAHDIKNYCRFTFDSIFEISWWYVSGDFATITIDEAENYSRCECETQKEIVTYRRVEIDPEVDYNFISLF